jgi:hypothetical protein
MKPVSEGDILARKRKIRKSECGTITVTDREIPIRRKPADGVESL